MSRLIICFLIVVSMISYSYAYPAKPQQDESTQNSTGANNEQAELTGGTAPKISKVIDQLLIYANTLQLTEQQKESLSAIREKYVYPIAKKETDHYIAIMKIRSLMQDPNFDVDQVKKETKILEEIAIEMAYMSIDAMAAIRSIVGIENFKTILSMLGKEGKK